MNETSVYRNSPEATPRSKIMAAALAYAERGVPVFPCKPAPDKSPHTRRGFKDATTDQSRVHAFWNAHPAANIGIPTGEASCFFVLDEDRPGALDELPGELPDTRTVRTPRGGRHVWLRVPEGLDIRNSAGKVLDGVDVRGEGGYVLVPPSTGYSWANDAPIADAPEWLLELLRTPEKCAPEEVKGDGQPVSFEVAGPPIQYGERNDTLARIAGRLHDGTRTADELADDLLAINEARCVPALPEPEVSKIARYMHARTPCKTSSGEVAPEVVAKLDSFEELLIGEPGRWKGNRWKTPRSVVVVLIKNARKHGKLLGDDVAVQISVRRLALETGTSLSTVQAAIDRLSRAGIIERANSDRSGVQAGTFVLKTPRAKSVHSSTALPPPATVPTLRAPRAPFTAERLRWSKPVMESEAGITVRVGTICRLGKTSEAIVDFLETCSAGASTVAEIGEHLGVKRTRDLRRRALARLADAGVIESHGDDVSLRLDWLDALNRRREEDEEIQDRERDRRKYAEQSRLHRLRLEALKLWKVGVSPEEIASNLAARTCDVRYVLGLPAAPVADAPRKEADGLIEELHRVSLEEDASSEGTGKNSPAPEIGAARMAENVPEEATEGSTPTESDDVFESDGESRPAVVVRAVEDLLRHHPEYRRLRTGQITCRLVRHDFTPPNFCPTDVEVEAALSGIAA